MRVEIITDPEQWNRFVEASPTGNITQTYEWGELRDALGGDVLRLGALENGELRGAMLVVVGRAPVLRRPYLYAPRGPVVNHTARKRANDGLGGLRSTLRKPREDEIAEKRK